jgi:hypothetical protein
MLQLMNRTVEIGLNDKADLRTTALLQEADWQGSRRVHLAG